MEKIFFGQIFDISCVINFALFEFNYSMLCFGINLSQFILLQTMDAFMNKYIVVYINNLWFAL